MGGITGYGVLTRDWRERPRLLPPLHRSVPYSYSKPVPAGERLRETERVGPGTELHIYREGTLGDVDAGEVGAVAYSCLTGK